MKRYIVIQGASSRKIVFTSRFECVAEVVAAVLQRRSGIHTKAYGLDCSPKAVADLTDELNATKDRLAEAVGVVYDLVARDDAGVWTTVHEADSPVADQYTVGQLLA